MFRKAVLSAVVALMASSAFAAGSMGKGRETERTKEREKVTSTRESGAGVSGTNKSAKAAEAAAEAALKANTQRDSARLVEELLNNPERFGLKGQSAKGVENFVLEVKQMTLQGKSFDEALEIALARRGSSKEDLAEKCKPVG